MYIQKIIRENIQTALKEIFQFETNNIELQQTKKEFEGDITLVVFPLIKELKLSPKEIAEKVLKLKSNDFSGKIVTKLSLLKNYCIAEEYHQKYLDKKF